MIPENEVWVKLGGDKGGGTFKMSLQLCNVEIANSVYNTIVFAIFKAGNNSFNLHVALQQYKKTKYFELKNSWGANGAPQT